ncbi:MAG TPA: Rne/Rng family ribonuclease [Thermoanaerobaculia bacterium]|nr:Rne/Rng family ribonuclease [Thermoanaerobaculia bacterium]
MTRKMLINAQRPEELRIAILDGSTLENYQVEASEASQSRGNIYRGVVASLQPSLNAAFIDYGAPKHGFLSLDNLVPEAAHHQPKGGKRRRIEEMLDRGKPLLVQIARDAEGQKGSALTTNVSLAGRYLVFTPWDDTRGVSRKVEDEELRQQLRDLTSSLRVPDGSGVIIRTNAVGQNKTAISKDLQALLRLWKQIQADSKQGNGPKLLQSDQDLILRALRDYLDAGMDEIVIDDEGAFEKAREYVRAFLPRSRTVLTRYAERAPLFARYDLEPQIDRIYERRVELPAGGSIVIDRTEALVAIDVNSGRSRAGGSHEETVVNTNLEAAREISRQLQLRDIGGLIVVDFIDMKNPKNRRRVETAVRDSLKSDKARTSVGKISANGLLEINRQKIRQALHLRTHRACPTCVGTGRIASPEMVSLNLLRRIEARATTSSLSAVRISLHPELADSFQNTRRREIAALEQEFKLTIEIIAASHLHRPEQELEWIDAEASHEDDAPAPRAASPKGAPRPAQSESSEPDGVKKRRRRRRRRGHQEESEVHLQDPEPDDGQEPEEESEASMEVASAPAMTSSVPGEPAGSEGGGRKRRRRRRRHRGSGTSATETSESAVDLPIYRAPSSDDLPPPEPPASDAAPPRPRPARKRRRRAAKPPAGTPVIEAAGEVASSFWEEGETSSPPPRRSRRRPGKTKTEGETPEALPNGE